MTSIVLARRYAKALFSLGKENGELDEIHAKLQGIHAFLSEAPDVEHSLANPVFPADIKKAVIDEIIKAFGITGILETFISMLVARRRIQCLRQILDAFQDLMDEEKGVVRAVVTTAVPLSGDIAQRVRDLLTKATGKEVVVHLQEEPAILGGVIARVGDMVWDGSLRSQLQGLKHYIERGGSR